MKTLPPKKAPASRSGGRISSHQAAVSRSSCKTWQSSSEITGFLYLFYYSPQGMSHNRRVTLRWKTIFSNASEFKGFKGFRRFRRFRRWWYRPSGDEYYSRLRDECSPARHSRQRRISVHGAFETIAVNSSRQEGAAVYRLSSIFYLLSSIVSPQKKTSLKGKSFTVPIRLLLFSPSPHGVHSSGCEGVHARSPRCWMLRRWRNRHRR